MLKIGNELKELLKESLYELLYSGKFQGVGAKVNISNIRTNYRGLRFQLAINDNLRDMSTIETFFNANELIDLGTIRFNSDASRATICCFRLKINNTGIEIIAFDEYFADDNSKIANSTNYQISKIEGIK